MNGCFSPGTASTQPVACCNHVGRHYLQGLHESLACLQVQFVLDDNFKLDDLLKLELHKFADEVGEIVDCAQKEEKMEQGLAKLKV